MEVMSIHNVWQACTLTPPAQHSDLCGHYPRPPTFGRVGIRRCTGQVGVGLKEGRPILEKGISLQSKKYFLGIVPVGFSRLDNNRMAGMVYTRPGSEELIAS